MLRKNCKGFVSVVLFSVFSLCMSGCAINPKCIYSDPLATNSYVTVEVYNRITINQQYVVLVEVDGNKVKQGATVVRDTLKMSPGKHTFLYGVSSFRLKPVESALFVYELKEGNTYVLDVEVYEELEKYVLKTKIHRI